jgi:hypothetical protein
MNIFLSHCHGITHTIKNTLLNIKGISKIRSCFSDRPSPPEAPLEYEEVTGSSVTLSWKPPKDNGGSEIT